MVGKTNTAFVDFVKNGGGVVIYHAADNSFPNWKEYNEMTGLGAGENAIRKMVHTFIIKIINLLQILQPEMEVLTEKGGNFWC